MLVAIFKVLKCDYSNKLKVEYYFHIVVLIVSLFIGRNRKK